MKICRTGCWFLVFGLSACTLGPMKVQQVRYLAVPSGENVNYYRISVKANTRLGKAEFRSGWYPMDAVDSLFGDVSAAGSIKALKVREDIRAAIDEQYLIAIKAFLTAAGDAEKSNNDLQKFLTAQKRILAVPGDLIDLPAGSIQIEYDPSRSLVIRHADDKLVFVLSSDPDETIGAIANFAEHQQTSVQVTRLAEVLGQQAVNKVAADEAAIVALQSTDQFLAQRLAQVLQVSADGDATKDDVVMEVEALLIVVDGLR